MNDYREKYILPSDEPEEPPVTQERPQRVSPTQPVRHPTSDLRASGTILLVIVVVLLLVVGFIRPRTSPTPATAAPLPLLVTPTSSPATLTSENPCVAVTRAYLKVITEQEIKQKWDVAAENAVAALGDPALCASDRSILAQKYITDALEGLYAFPFDPSKAAQEEMVEERYHTIRRQAQQYAQLYDVTVPRPLAVAQRAAQTGKFLLVLSAYDESWGESFTAADYPLIKDYISNCYNIGKYWTERRDSPTFAEGAAYLSASFHLEQKYRTGQAEAWQRLRELFGPDESTWPEPIKTPLLDP